jgi:hypothetical protein
MGTKMASLTMMDKDVPYTSAPYRISKAAETALIRSWVRDPTAKGVSTHTHAHTHNHTHVAPLVCGNIEWCSPHLPYAFAGFHHLQLRVCLYVLMCAWMYPRILVSVSVYVYVYVCVSLCIFV